MDKNFVKVKKISKNKKTVILLIVVLILLLIANLVINNLSKKNKSNNAQSEYSSIKEIVEFYGCTYIKETKNKNDEFSVDIYLKFKYDPFDSALKKNNQRYYENIISAISNFNKEGFRLIDEGRNLNIEVKRNVNNQGNVLYSYLVNGKDNYFSKEESKNSLANLEEDKNSNLEINSPILNALIQNNWNPNAVDFGSIDSTFEKYDIYFDEGMESRVISNKVYNLVFTNNYKEQVLNGITVGTSFENITAKLGEPTYGMSDAGYIGYKNSKLYVFFTEDKISIYRNQNEDVASFEVLLKKYTSNEINIKQFMNELTYLWDDYEEYKYDSSSIYISYPIKGVKISMSYDDTMGIIIYKNYDMTDTTKELIENEKIKAYLDKDLVDECFLKKYNEYYDKVYLASLSVENLDGEISKDARESNLYYTYIDENKVQFISKNNMSPNRELNEAIDSYTFINDNIFLYSIKNKGIYWFNASTGEKQGLISGNDEFEIIDYNNGILKYDNKMVNIVME